MSEHHAHHSHEQNVPPSVLLGSMIDHNNHHFSELEALASTLGGETGEAISAAVELMRSGNEKLAEVLRDLEAK